MSAVDILIVTILAEEYQAVLAELKRPERVPGSSASPNNFAWRTGTIPCEHGGEYRVVVALAGSAGNVNASQVLSRSVTRWSPRYVLLVGIAGGLPSAGCQVGDVVVATEVFGYEYGKIDDGFVPRPNWTFQMDSGLRANAQSFVAANPEWSSSLGHPPPTVRFGPIAAGDKVVDNPSDPAFAPVLARWPKLCAVEMEGAGAAQAIEIMRAEGSPLGFIVVRGISDVPRPRATPGEEGTQTAERDANKRRACKVAAHLVARWIACEWPVPPERGAQEISVATTTLAAAVPTPAAPPIQREVEPEPVAPPPLATEALPAVDPVRKSPELDLAFTYSIQKMYQDRQGHVFRHDYLGKVRLENRGQSIVRNWEAEVEMPAILIDARRPLRETVRRVIGSPDAEARQAIYPGKSVTVSFAYAVDDIVYQADRESSIGGILVRVFVDDFLLVQKGIPYSEVQNF